MSKDESKYLVVRRFHRREIPRRVCDTLKQARLIAAAYRQTWFVTEHDRSLAQEGLGSPLYSIIIYRIDARGQVVEFVESI